MTDGQINELLQRAQGAWQRAEPHAALQLCDRAALLSARGRYAAARLRGDILLQLGDAKGALSSYDSVADPAVADAHLDCSRGLALFELGRFAEANGALRSALRDLPDLPEAYQALGIMAEISGTGEETEFFRRARRLAPQRYLAQPRLTAAQFEAVLQRALGRLPTALRPLMEGMTVLVQEMPRLEDLRRSSPPLSPLSLGTFCRAQPVGAPTEIDMPALLLFKRNLERSCADEVRLETVIVELVEQEAGTARRVAAAPGGMPVPPPPAPLSPRDP